MRSGDNDEWLDDETIIEKRAIESLYIGALGFYELPQLSILLGVGNAGVSIPVAQYFRDVVKLGLGGNAKPELIVLTIVDILVVTTCMFDEIRLKYDATVCERIPVKYHFLQMNIRFREKNRSFFSVDDIDVGAPDYAVTRITL